MSVFSTHPKSYADSVEPRWDSFGVLLDPLSSTIPYMVQVGVSSFF